jgi:lipopolysaccharide export system permease protein
LGGAVEGPAAVPKRRTKLLGFPSLLDSGVLKSLVASFAISVITLVGIFQIFTLFELWRYIVASKSGVRLIAQYLFFLVPFVLIQLGPAATLIAVLATYALMARRSESVAWWASGQSVYRLFLPGLVFGIAVGCATWYLQERVMPSANVRQDALRSQLKTGLPRTTTRSGRQWMASMDSKRLYSFDYIDQQNTINTVTVFEFDPSGIHLTKVMRADRARWTADGSASLEQGEAFYFDNQSVEREQFATMPLPNAEKFELFKPGTDKPSQLNAHDLSDYIKLNKQRGVDVASLLVAFYRKHAEPFGAIVMTLLGAPLALSFGRRNVVAGLCISIMVGIAFWAVSGGFQQLGTFGMLPAAVAAFAPFVIFGSVGLYLLSRTKT